MARLAQLRGMPEDLVLLTVAEVALVLDVSTPQVRHLLASGGIPGSWTPNGQRVSLLDLRRYLSGEYELLPVETAAERLGVSVKTVMAYLTSGELSGGTNAAGRYVTAYSVESKLLGRPEIPNLERMVRAGWLGAPVDAWPEPGPWPVSAEPTVYGGGQWQQEVWTGTVRMLSRGLAGRARRMMVRLPYGVLAIQSDDESEGRLKTAVERAGGDWTVRGFTPVIETVRSPMTKWRLYRIPEDADLRALIPALHLEPLRGVRVHHQDHGYVPMPVLPDTAQDGEMILRDARGGFPAFLLGDLRPERIPEIPETWLGVLLQTLGI